MRRHHALLGAVAVALIGCSESGTESTGPTESKSESGLTEQAKEPHQQNTDRVQTARESVKQEAGGAADSPLEMDEAIRDPMQQQAAEETWEQTQDYLESLKERAAELTRQAAEAQQQDDGGQMELPATE